VTVTERAPLDGWLAELARLGPEKARQALEEFFAESTVVELAALDADWPSWARPKQMPPAGQWRSWGFITGRGYGKTLSVSKHVNEEVLSGRAMLICLLAQDEQSAIDLMVLGPSGLIATAAPLSKPRWEASSLQLVWPNGARAYVRTPEVPGKIRGLEYHLGWACEIQSWPTATRDEAWSNLLLSVRLGYARVVWDCTPKRGHPILKELLKRAEDEPGKHYVVRGSTYENAGNLGDGYVEDLEARYAGTTQGREELGGEMLDDEAGTTVTQTVIDRYRLPMPPRLVRRIVSIDPSTTSGSDTTGILDLGLGPDGQAYVIADQTGKHDVRLWGQIALDLYLTGKCDCMVVETNYGNDLLAQNLRAEVGDRGVSVIVLPKGAQPPPHNPKIVYVREVFVKGASKTERAKPVGTAYERGRISHVTGANLTSLEETLTSWVAKPGAKSPGDLDALVHGLVELLSLTEDRPDPRTAFTGIVAASQALQGRGQPPKRSLNMATLLGGGGRPRGL
jgi:phage terminase large subunit-like protein